MTPGTSHDSWGHDPRTVTVVAHNVSTRYLAYLIDAVLGLVMLPFNVAHLGMAAYGLWVLTTSVTAYLSMLDLGYGGALVRFVAQYRARRDATALNEVLSTLAVVYSTIGAITYTIVLVVAANVHHLARLTPDQLSTARTLLLIVGANVALRFVFGIYGGVIVGFQRYHLNNLTSIGTSLAVAGTNVLVLLGGHGLVELVAATTAVRVAALFIYRLNAARVFPGLALDWRLFRRERLREVTGFSVFMIALDAAYRVNYSSDVMVIGALLGAPAVALWAPAQRLTEVTLRLSNQLSEALFPVVVDCDAAPASRTAPQAVRRGHEAVAGDGSSGCGRSGAARPPAPDGVDRSERSPPPPWSSRSSPGRLSCGSAALLPRSFSRELACTAAHRARRPDGFRQPHAQHCARGAASGSSGWRSARRFR